MSVRILLDVDGVCADFMTPTLAALNAITGESYTVDDVTEWSLEASLKLSPEVCDLLDEVICRPGFCADLDMYQDARWGVEELRAIGEVYACTSPYDSDYWHREREQWLIKHLGFRRNEIIFAVDKHVAAGGNVLVDDKPSTLAHWQAERGGDAILFEQPWNRAETPPGVMRAVDWQHLVAMIRMRWGGR